MEARRRDAHAVDDPEPIDQYSAEDWRDHDGQSFDDHLNAHAHGVAICFECGADE